MNARRLPTFVHADLIVVMNEGRAVGKGTHAQLLELRGLYYELWMTQRKGFKSEEVTDLAAGIKELQTSSRQLHKGPEGKDEWPKQESDHALQVLAIARTKANCQAVKFVSIFRNSAGRPLT